MLRFCHYVDDISILTFKFFEFWVSYKVRLIFLGFSNHCLPKPLRIGNEIPWLRLKFVYFSSYGKYYTQS